MLIEGSENEEEPLGGKSRVSETGHRPKPWVLAQEAASRFHGIQVTVRYRPASVDRIPFHLPLKVGKEFVRFANVHEVTAG